VPDPRKRVRHSALGVRASPVLATAYSQRVIARVIELCLRCGAEMEWRHGTWQCPKCRFKIGCCEGECPND